MKYIFFKEQLSLAQWQQTQKNTGLLRDGTGPEVSWNRLCALEPRWRQNHRLSVQRPGGHPVPWFPAWGISSPSCTYLAGCEWVPRGTSVSEGQPGIDKATMTHPSRQPPDCPGQAVTLGVLSPLLVANGVKAQAHIPENGWPYSVAPCMMPGHYHPSLRPLPARGISPARRDLHSQGI